MSDESNWFNEGHNEEDSAAAAAERKGSSQRRSRLWLPQNGETQVVFLGNTDPGPEPIEFWEHAVFLNDSWANWFTCIKKINQKGCPLCDAHQVNPKKGRIKYGRYMSMFSLVELTEFTTKAGTQVINPAKILPAGSNTYSILKEYQNELGSFLNRVFKVKRTGPKEANCGNVFIPTGEMKWKGTTWTDFEGVRHTVQSKSEIPGPWNLIEMFEPKPYKQLAEIARAAGGNAPDSQNDYGSGSGNGKSSKTDDGKDIPF